jgi:hypothetical protein
MGTGTNIMLLLLLRQNPVWLPASRFSIMYPLPPPANVAANLSILAQRPGKYSG